MEYSCYFIIDDRESDSRDAKINDKLDSFFHHIIGQLNHPGLPFSINSEHTLQLRLMKSGDVNVDELPELSNHVRYCPYVLKIFSEISNVIEEQEKIKLRTLFRKRVNDLWIALILCSAGAIQARNKGVIRMDNEIQRIGDSFVLETNRYVHSISSVVMEALEREWPKPLTLDLDVTWNWLLNFKDEIDFISKTKIGRAINALTHVIQYSGDISPEGIFWAAIGIESLYTESSNNVLDQIDTKSQLFLGERKSYLRVFKEFYDYRSRLLHGDINFPSNHYLMEEGDDFDLFIKNQLQKSSVAISVLFCTLQKMIDKDLGGLIFDKKIELKYKKIPHPIWLNYN